MVRSAILYMVLTAGKCNTCTISCMQCSGSGGVNTNWYISNDTNEVFCVILSACMYIYMLLRRLY